MGAKFYFLDNDEYTAQDMNNVLSTLTTQGVSLYKQSGTALMDYEEAIKNLVEPGVDIYNTEACKIVKGDDGNYYASAGTCWLPDGSCMVIDDEKLAVENYTVGQLNYVYARHDRVTNRIFVGASTEKITEYAVKLAEIDAEGNVSDMRVFAVSKIAVPTANIIFNGTAALAWYYPYNSGSGLEFDNVVKIDTGYSGWHFLYMREPRESYPDNYLYDLSDGEEHGINMYNWRQPYWLTAKKNGSVIEFHCKQRDERYTFYKEDVPIKVI